MTEENDFGEDIPSKSQRKREMTALQQLGSELTTFKPAQLDKLPLTDRLQKAIAEYKRIPNSHEAKRRQLQFIGRLMRGVDIASLHSAIEALHTPASPRAVAVDKVEQICTTILNDGDSGINSVLSTHQHLERSVLRKFYLESKKIDAAEQPDQLELVKQRLIKYLKKNM